MTTLPLRQVVETLRDSARKKAERGRSPIKAATLWAWLLKAPVAYVVEEGHAKGRADAFDEILALLDGRHDTIEVVEYCSRCREARPEEGQS